jgi:hypothetical protein
MEAGNYFGRVTGIAMMTVNDKEKFVVNVNISHYDIGGTWQAIDPVDIKVSWYASDAAFESTAKKLEAIGFNNDLANPAFSDEASTTGVAWRMAFEQYKGKPVERWELVDWGGAKAADDDTKRRILARLKARGTSTASAPAAPPPGPRWTAKAASGWWKTATAPCWWWPLKTERLSP